MDRLLERTARRLPLLAALLFLTMLFAVPAIAHGQPSPGEPPTGQTRAEEPQAGESPTTVEAADQDADATEGEEAAEPADEGEGQGEAQEEETARPRRRAQPAVPQRTPEQMEGDRLVIEALGHVQEGQFKEAEEKFREALESDPENATAHTYLCFLAFRRGEFNPARQACNEALGINPNIPLALLVTARIDEASRQLETAEQGYGAAATAGESSPTAATDGGLAIAGHAHYLKGLLEAQRGDSEGAIADFDAAIRIFPNNAYAYYERGLEMLALGRNDEAAESLGKALEERSKWFSSEAWLGPIRRYLFLEENAHYWRGVALLRGSHYQEAADELTPLIPTVESRIGSEITPASNDAGDLLRILEGETELSYYRAPLELAKALKELGQGKEAVSVLRSYLKYEVSNKARIKEAKELLKLVR